MALLFPFIRGAFFRQVLTALVGLCVFSAQAQWQWLDKDGRRMFSDRPPPADVPEKSILKRPGQPVQSAAANPAASVGAQGNIPKLPAADNELEKKKKASSDQETAKRKADEEKFAVAKAENCSRAQADKRTLDSGVRLSRTNAQGEREVFDEKIRGEETARLQGVINSDCK